MGGRLSEKEIERMIEQAEEYAKEDQIVVERVAARNGLESYLHNLKNHMEDESRSSNLPTEDKQDLLELVQEKLDWMEGNPEALREDYEDHQKEVERVANPLMRKFYGESGRGEND